MIADVTITEKSFGPKTLMTGVKFSIDDSEKVGVVGRNGIGKSTLFGILAGTDKDFTGEVIYRRGVTVVATAQEHSHVGDQTVLQYVLSGLTKKVFIKLRKTSSANWITSSLRVQRTGHSLPFRVARSALLRW